MSFDLSQWREKSGDAEWLWQLYLHTIEANPYIPKQTPDNYPWKAYPKQIEFLTMTCSEAFYGGAGGGGKSSALLMAALQFAHIVPNYHALILRNASPDLKQADGLIPRAMEWFGHLAKWNETYRFFTFPNGSTLRLGQLGEENDKYKYRGGAWQFIAYDELSLFTQTQYTYLFSRRRKLVGMDIPLRTRSASNPGGRGHGWVKQRFVKPGSADRPFIPALIADNPSLDAKSYREGLAQMDVHERRQIEEGSWDEFQGGRFLRQWLREWTAKRDAHGIMRFVLHERPAATFCDPKPAGDPNGIQCRQCWTFITVDPAASVKAASDYTVIGVFAVTPWRDILVLDMVREQTRVDAIVPKIAEVCQDYSPLWVGIEDTGFQVMLKDAARKHPGIPAVRGLKHEGLDKLVRATPAINYAAEGRIYFPPPIPEYPWVDECVAEIVQFTGDPKLDAHDDVVDVLSYAVRYLDKFGLTSRPIVVESSDRVPLRRIGYDDGYKPSGFTAHFGR